MAEEKIYYDKNGVKITESRAIINDTTYPMNNISSVSTGMKENSPLGAYGIGGGLIVMSIMGMRETGAAALIGIVAGILICAFGTTMKNNYIVKIGSAGSEKDGLASQDKEYIEEIVNAINEAIIARG